MTSKEDLNRLRIDYEWAADEIERLTQELKTEQVLRTTWTKAAEDLAAQRDRLRAALERISLQSCGCGQVAGEALAGQSRPGETAALLTDAQCESVISELGYREWTGISKGDVRLWDTLIQQAREETAARHLTEGERGALERALDKSVEVIDGGYEETRGTGWCTCGAKLFQWETDMVIEDATSIHYRARPCHQKSPAETSGG